jgi:hypothetical protein
MNMTIALCDDIKWHHSTEDAAPGQSSAQDPNIADAVLQANDDSVFRSMIRDQLRHLRRIAAFNRDQNDLRLTHDCGVIRQLQLTGGEALIEAIEARQPQAVRLDAVHDAPPRQYADVATGCRQGAPHETADTAGTGNTDGSRSDHVISRSSSTRY